MIVSEITNQSTFPHFVSVIPNISGHNQLCSLANMPIKDN